MYFGVDIGAKVGEGIELQIYVDCVTMHVIWTVGLIGKDVDFYYE